MRRVRSTEVLLGIILELKNRMITLNIHDARMCRAKWGSGGPEIDMSRPPGFRIPRDLLSSLQSCFLDQPLPGGQANEGDGRRFFHGDGFGLEREVRFLDRDAFGERTDASSVGRA